jgi:hypothetical protein
MIDVASEIVNAIAVGTGNSLGANGVAGAGRLISALRAKFRDSPEATRALEIAAEQPAEQPALDGLAALLRDRAAHNSAFAAWLDNLWAEARQETSNVITGTVHGTVVQARDIHGDIHIGRPE